MKNTKKLSAAIMVVVMLVSMLSCMVVPVASAAASTTLGEPISIETNISTGSGIVVGGKTLPNNILVVYSGWAGKTGTVPIKLGGIVYGAIMGVNAFSEIADAATAAGVDNTIYVAAGTYSAQVDVNVSGLKIYGPYAGVSPNAPFNGSAKNLAVANTNRPAAISATADTTNEAVFSGRISIPKAGPHTTVDGLYFTGSACDFQNQSGATRNGTYVRNCIVNVSTTTFFNMDRGVNGNFVFEDNRVLNAKTMMAVGGVLDIRYSRNYFNQTNLTLNPSSFAAGAMGTSCIVEDSYYEKCNGIIAYNRPTPYQVVLYSMIVRNNYIMECGPDHSLVTNHYFATGSLPGISVQVTGNTILGVNKNKPVLTLNYYASQSKPSIYRYMVNVNENYVDLPEGATFIDSSMNGVLNCGYNYYTSAISAKQVKKYEETTLILYPYYSDPEMTQLAGDARITKVNLSYPYEIDSEELTVHIDMKGTTYSTVNMDAALSVSEGCTWELYEDKTLEKKIANKTLYFDGIVTERYAAIYTPDGILSNVYSIIVEREYGSEAKVVDVLVNNSNVPSPEVLGTAYIFDVPSNVAFLEYDIKVSSGATYTLYSDSACTKKLEDIGSYIPYGEYKFYVWVKSEDKTMDGKYSVTFNRERSALYDPCIIDVTVPATGDTMVRPDRLNPNQLWMTYYADTLLGSAKFDFETTFGASWKLYKDSAKKTLLSSSTAIKDVKLTAGTNTFYVEVSDAANSNTVTFVVENQTLSSDATITGIMSYSPTIIDGKMYVTGFGKNFNAMFTTGSPYAVCEVYADPALKLPIKYTSTPVTEPNSIRVIDNRSFNLQIEHATSVYYVKCIAENGAEKVYTLSISKIVSATAFKDVRDNAWYAEAIAEASGAGYLLGEGSGKDFVFRPNDKTTREEMATVAARLMGYNADAYSGVKLNMKDVSSIASWARGYVKVCYQNGIMKGNARSDGIYFNPKANITRQEVMVMFARMFNLNGTYDLSEFSDAGDIASWAKSGVEAVVASGLIVGSNGRLNPKASITRAELATMISRAK